MFLIKNNADKRMAVVRGAAGPDCSAPPFCSYEFEKKEEKTEASAAKKEEDCQQTGSLSGMGRERKTD